MAFAWYRRLSKKNRAVVRRSDALMAPEIPAPEQLEPCLAGILHGLGDDDRARTERGAGALVTRLCDQLEIPRVRVKVLAVRPHDEVSELHGLYSFEEGKVPEIRVWMRTAKRKQPVAFRTFVRTLLHEVAHHLDFAFFELPDSFHTEGFYRREANLVRQLIGTVHDLDDDDATSDDDAPAPDASPAAQLDLFGASS